MIFLMDANDRNLCLILRERNAFFRKSFYPRIWTWTRRRSWSSAGPIITKFQARRGSNIRELPNFSTIGFANRIVFDFLGFRLCPMAPLLTNDLDAEAMKFKRHQLQLLCPKVNSSLQIDIEVRRISVSLRFCLIGQHFDQRRCQPLSQDLSPWS